MAIFSGFSAQIVAIGVSTGGPAALGTLLANLPKNLTAPVLVVQHMPPVFTKLLAERLQETAALKVVEASNGEEIKAGCVYVAPGGQHMEIKRVCGNTMAFLHDGPPENSCRPAVDVLFRSVAKTYGHSALAAVLTGMGSDGLKGALAIKESGGMIVAQDRETSAVWGMPGAVVEAGVASAVLSPMDIARGIALSTMQAPGTSCNPDIKSSSIIK